MIYEYNQQQSIIPGQVTKFRDELVDQLSMMFGEELFHKERERKIIRLNDRLAKAEKGALP